MKTVILGKWYFLVVSYFFLLKIPRNIIPLSHILFANVFSHSIGCLCTLLVTSFAMQTLSLLMSSHLSIFVFVLVLLVSHTRNHCQDECHESFRLFSSWSFIVSGLTSMFTSLVLVSSFLCMV